MHAGKLDRTHDDGHEWNWYGRNESLQPSLEGDTSIDRIWVDEDLKKIVNDFAYDRIKTAYKTTSFDISSELSLR